MHVGEYIEMEAQEEKAGKSTVLLIAVIKQKRRCRDVSETRALTANAPFYNHDDESVGKTRVSFAVALARFSHTETPPLTQIHTQRQKMNRVVSLDVGLQVVKDTFQQRKLLTHCERWIFRMNFFLTK